MSYSPIEGTSGLNGSAFDHEYIAPGFKPRPGYVPMLEECYTFRIASLHLDIMPI